MTVCKVSCMFQSCAPAPDNTKSIKAQAPAEPEMRIMVKRKLTVGGLIGCLASVTHYHKKREKSEFLRHYDGIPTCSFFVEYDSRFSVALFQTATDEAETPPERTFTFPTKRYNVALSNRTTRVRVPLARNPSPLQHPTLYVQKFLR